MGVEQKVRMNLSLERLELSLRELGFQLRGLKLSFAEPLIIIECLIGADDCPIDQQVDMKGISQKRNKSFLNLNSFTKTEEKLEFLKGNGW